MPRRKAAKTEPNGESKSDDSAVSSGKRWRFRLLAIPISTVFALALAELYVRISGQEAWTPMENLAHLPVMTVPDDELGWTSKPGRYHYSVTNDDRNMITITINPDESRGVLPERPDRPEVWFFGGSCTFGSGVTDGQEYPAQIAQQLPRFRVRNFGSPGYSTLQSLLLFRRQLKAHHKPPVLVVYGFIHQHGARNVGTSQWLKSLRRIAGERAYVALPYARFNDEDELAFYPLRKYVKWPLSEHLASLSLLQDRLASINESEVISQSGHVTIELLRRWKEEAKVLAELIVFCIWDTTGSKFFLNHCFQKNITFLDCGKIPYPGPDTAVPIDGHPNVVIHRLWTSRFLEHVKPSQAPKR